jgi:uncharacterized protein (DUF4415 family)
MNGNTTLQASDDLDEAPVWSPEDFAQAVHRVGLQSTPMKKQKINITLDPDVVAWFKQQAGGRGYQTLINADLARSDAAKDNRRDAAASDPGGIALGLKAGVRRLELSNHACDP